MNINIQGDFFLTGFIFGFGFWLSKQLVCEIFKLIDSILKSK